jgi:hypothetical protein
MNEIEELKKKYRVTLEQAEGLKDKIATIQQKAKTLRELIVSDRERAKVSEALHKENLLKFAAETVSLADFSATKKTFRMVTEAVADREELFNATETVLQNLQIDLKNLEVQAADQKQGIFKEEAAELVKELQDQAYDRVKRIFALRSLSHHGFLKFGGRRWGDFLLEVFPEDEAENQRLQKEIAQTF